jgi:putative inorganic carbon (HCO3(-)) transporter
MSPRAGVRSGVVVRDGLLVALTIGLAASITLSETTLVVLALWLLLGPRAARAPGRGWPLLAPLAAFAAWTLVAALASPQPLESLAATRGLLTLGAFYVVLHALPDRRAAARFSAGLLLAVSLVALLGIVQVAVCPASGSVESASAPLRLLFRKCARARGFFSIYMTLGGVLALVLVSALPRLARGGRSLAWAGPAWLVSLVALGLTYVRGAWLGFAAGAAAGALALPRRRLVLAGLALLIAGALFVEPGVLERVRSIGDFDDNSLRDRLAMLETGLALARAHPLTGIGPGQVKRVYPAWASAEALRRSTSHLHDTPLQIVVERGLPGLAAWVAIWVGFFRAAWRVLARLGPGDGEARALVLGSITAIAAFLIAGLFEYNFGDTEVLLVAMALMALPFVVARDPASGAGGRPEGA